MLVLIGFCVAVVVCGSATTEFDLDETSSSKLLTNVLRSLADGSMSMNEAKGQPQTASAQAGDDDSSNTRSMLLHSDDRIGFTAAVEDPSKAAALAERLQTLGAVYVSSFGGIVSGFIEPQLLNEFEKIDELKFAREEYVTTNIGAQTSEGDVASFADKVRSTLSCAGKAIDGTGITVGILSDSFSCLGIGAGQATNDIPSVEILEERSSCSGATDEGRAMAEIVHDLAPGAKIKFCSASNGLAAFANCIVKLQQAGCNVIVDDVLYFSEAIYQDDVIAQAVDLVKSRGVSYFSSAGNAARDAYEAPFRSTTATVTFTNAGTITNGVFHDFDPSAATEIFQRFTVASGTHTNIVILKWLDRYFSISGSPGAASDLDILVVQINAGPTFTVVALAQAINLGGDAFEGLLLASLGVGNYAVMIRLRGGPAPALLKHTMYRGSLPELQFKTNSGTSQGHANARGAMGIGAVNAVKTPAFGVNPPVLESFSSSGGQLVFFDTRGNLLTAPENRRKPDISCLDGGVTTFFSGTPPRFFGTSAAAPHAAAIAALTLQARPSLSVDEVYSILKKTAVDFLAAGYDEESGTGLCNAAAAVNAAVNDQIVNQSAPQPCESNRCALFSATGIIPPLAATVCRSATQSCDLAETCSSASASCPNDVKKSFGDTCNDGNAATSNDICVTGDTCCGRTSTTDRQLTLTGPLQSLFVSDPRTSSLGVLSCNNGQQNRRRDVESSSSSSSDDDSDDDVSREVAFRFQVSLDKAVDCDVEAIWYIDTTAVARAIWHKSHSKLHLSAIKTGRLRFGLHNIRVELSQAGKDVCSVPLSPFTAITDVKFK